VERFEIRILRVSDATDGCEWSNLMYLVILILIFDKVIFQGKSVIDYWTDRLKDGHGGDCMLSI
jgi:hypothetical protein